MCDKAVLVDFKENLLDNFRLLNSIHKVLGKLRLIFHALESNADSLGTSKSFEIHKDALSIYVHSLRSTNIVSLLKEEMMFHGGI